MWFVVSLYNYANVKQIVEACKYITSKMIVKSKFDNHFALW